MSKLYVGNLAFDLDPRDLEDIFAKVRLCLLVAGWLAGYSRLMCGAGIYQYGHVLNVSIKRGYGFVHFDSAKDAEVGLSSSFH